MTADEYKAMHDKAKKYEYLEECLRVIKNRKKDCEKGISKIIPVSEYGENEFVLKYTCFGDGFQKLVTQKVIEAFDEQISRIEKQMEEL